MRFVTYQPRLVYPDVPQLQLADYAHGRKCFIERFLQNFRGEVAFYGFGATRTPGVSDIDLLIVVEDGQWKTARKLARRIIESSGFLYYLFVHEPLVICQSLISCLPAIHTVQNCCFLQGTWHPFEQSDAQERLTGGILLFRHALWNSFIRVAALEMEQSVIGLRRSLTLLHNLLESANNGNKLLENPIPIPISTDEIRSEVLAAPWSDQERIIKEYIRQVLDVLNTVDALLDKELAPGLGFNPSQFSVIPLSKKRFLVTPVSSATDCSSQEEYAFLRGVEIIPVPVYLTFITMLIAQRLRSHFPELHVFRRYIAHQSTDSSTDFLSFAEKIETLFGIFQRHGVNYFFPKPFSVNQLNLSPRGHFALLIRRYFVKRALCPK